MDSKPPNYSRVENSLRDIAVSRRGGVRVRGGRLPPICMRNVIQTTGAKKVVAPNIPQRRVVVKKELTVPSEPLQLKSESKKDFRQKKGRQAKVILQTDGTFLADGPAARIKRDMVGLDTGFSIPRVSYKKTECEAKYDFEMIKDVLDCYEANQFYEDDFGNIPPYRLPLLKEKRVTKIKTEPDDDDDGMKVEIKRETTDDKDTLKENSPDVKNPVDFFKDVNEGSMMILLRLPSDFPFMKQIDETNSKDEVKEKGREGDGLIGKLRFMRSGQMKIVLKSAELELMDEVPSESYMEAATIRISEDRADLSILGKIDRRMVLCPILEGLLEGEKQPPPKCDAE